MKTLLVPTDFSAHADGALDFALVLARQHRARLILLNAFQFPVAAGPLPFETAQGMQEDKADAVIARLRSECDRIRATNIDCEYHAREGSAARVIVQFAKENPVDLIVMGTRGENSLGDMFFGTIALDVMNQTDCPVLAVPGTIKTSKALKKITYATDFLQSDLEALGHVTELALPFNAQLCLLHISPFPEEVETDAGKLYEFTSLIEEETGYKKLSFELLEGEDVEAELLDYVKKGKTDLLVMSTSHRGTLSALFNPSKTHRLSATSPVPVVAFHHPRKERAMVR